MLNTKFRSVAARHIPLSTSQAQPENTGKCLIVGVAVISPTSKKLPILQRAAHEDSYAGMYELPGGHTEDADATILDTIVRELKEETGLAVRRIVAESDEGFEYETRKGTVKQLNFLVEVEAEDMDGVECMETCVEMNPMGTRRMRGLQESRR